MPYVRILLVLLAFASPALAQDGARDTAAAREAAQAFKVYVDGVAKKGGRPDLRRPDVAALLDRIFDLDAFNALPPAQASDLDWLPDWIGAANAVNKLVTRFGSKAGPQPDLAAVQRNATEYEDQFAAAMNFMIRGMAREAVASQMFMAALAPEQRTRVREEGLAGLRISTAEFILEAVCAVIQSGGKPANARLVAAAIRDTREVWADFFLAQDRSRVIEYLADPTKVPDETARTDLATFTAALQAVGSALAVAKQDCDHSTGDASIQACDEAIRADPRDAVSYHNRGVGYFHKGDFDRAVADFSEAIEINPKLAGTYVARGVIFEEKGDLDRAIADSNKAIEIDPRYAPAYSNRGNVLMHKGDLDGAIADYSKSIEIDPVQNNGAHLNAYCNRGFAYQRKHDLDRALADFAKAIDVDPKQALAYIGRGFILRVKGDLDGAIADYSKAIEVDPAHALPYITRAEAYGDKGDVDRAISDFDKAIEIEPKNAAPYNSRCRFLAKSNRDLPLALSDCDDAVRLAPNKANIMDSRGFVYLRLGRFDEAIADYDAALMINPKWVGALYGRGLAKQKKGDQAGGDADIAAAKAIKATIADEFAKYGVN